jgi:hypothetical protein
VQPEFQRFYPCRTPITSADDGASCGFAIFRGAAQKWPDQVNTSAFLGTDLMGQADNFRIARHSGAIENDWAGPSKSLQQNGLISEAKAFNRTSSGDSDQFVPVKRRLAKRALQNATTVAEAVRIITSRQKDSRYDTNAAPTEICTSLGNVQAAQAPPNSRPAVAAQARAITRSPNIADTPPHAAATTMARSRHCPMLRYLRAGVTSQYRYRIPIMTAVSDVPKISRLRKATGH